MLKFEHEDALIEGLDDDTDDCMYQIFFHNNYILVKISRLPLFKQTLTTAGCGFWHKWRPSSEGLILLG